MPAKRVRPGPPRIKGAIPMSLVRKAVKKLVSQRNKSSATSKEFKEFKEFMEEVHACGQQ